MLLVGYTPLILIRAQAVLSLLFQRLLNETLQSRMITVDTFTSVSIPFANKPAMRWRTF